MYLMIQQLSRVMQVQEDYDKWRRKWESLEITPQILNSITKLQALFRKRKAAKKIKKMLRHRKYVIQELIKTQQTYLYDISLIICDYKFPMKQLKLIDSAIQAQIFGYIQEIKKVNEEFYVELYNKFQGFHDYLTMFDEQMFKMVPYFKLYFQYIKNYQPSMKIITHLTETNLEFKKFLDGKKNNPKYRGLTMDSFMIKPIQRLPKYVILLKDLVKHTPDWHPDYNNILRFLATIEQVNCHNNESMNKLLKDLKISELEKNLSIPLISAGREFVCEEAVNILVNNKIKGILMYLFTDLILLTYKHKNQEKVHNQISLSRGSFCKDMKDLTYFKNLFSVSGNEGKLSTFVCSSEEEKRKLMSKITKTLENLNQKQAEKAKIFISNKIHNESVIRKIEDASFQVEIDVLGTEERNSLSITNYTVYIIQVKIKNIKHKIFVRFNQLLKIQEYIIKEYPKLLSQGQMLVKTNWLKNHLNRVIEQRKLQIQEFLQSILSMREIRENGSEVLVRLGLPEDFYHLPEKIKGVGRESSGKSIRRSQVGGSVSRRVSARSYYQELEHSSSEDDSEDQLTFKSQKQRYKKSTPNSPRSSKNLTAQQILYANQMTLGHFTRISNNTSKRQSQEQDLIDVIIMIPSQKLVYKELVMRIDKNTRIQHLTILTATKIGLKYYKDFRFLLKESSTINRILDDDEIIENILQASSHTKIFGSGTPIYFQKFIYIHTHLEDKEFKEDRVRLALLSNQALIEIKEYRIRIEYQDYLVFICLYMILNSYSPKASYIKQVIQSILPEEIYYSFEAELWIDDTDKCYKIIMQKLKMIYDNQKSKGQFRLSSVIGDKEHHQYTADFGCIVRLAILNQLQKHFLYGTTLEIVQISQQTRDYLKKLHSKMTLAPTRNIWLGIKYDELMLISADLSQILLKIKYDELCDIKCEPHCIMIGTESLIFKLKTNRSYFVSELIEYYLKYMELYQRMDKDKKYSESLITRAREQMKSVIMQEIDEDQESERFSAR